MRIKWIIYSISGLILFGMGLSLMGEAIVLKYKQSGNWFVLGTLALIITNSGLCLFGQAIIEKVKLLRHKEKNDQRGS